MCEVSIVICSFKHVDLLRGAVKSLIDQTASPECYEVIIVDNDPTPNKAFQNIVEEASQIISIRYVHEKKSGLSQARNKGGKIATGDYICYLDDDAKANPEYIASLIDIIQEVSPDLCGGPHFPFYLSPKPEWFLDRYGMDSKGKSPRYLQSNEYICGLNMVLKRSLLEDLDWFNTELGQVGYKRIGGEDTYIQIKARQKYPNLKLYYDPRLCVHHLVPSRKMILWRHLRMVCQTSYSQVYFWLPKEEFRSAQIQAPRHLIWNVLTLVCKTLPEIKFRDRKKYPYWQNYIYEVTSKYLGNIASQIRLIIDFFFRRTVDLSGT